MDQLDAFDRKILAAVQSDARLTNVELAERVHLSASQCARRLQRLEEIGAITAYRAVLDARMIGLGIIGIVTVKLDRQVKENIRAFQDEVMARPEIIECISITGEGDYELRVAAADLHGFSRFLLDVIVPMPGVSSTRSSIILDHVKSMAGLPVAEA
jgi:Lrp/AsnC family transcriptional regulator, leucine-responsive regulatory protein